jgi:hypothetical protein
MNVARVRAASRSHNVNIEHSGKAHDQLRALSPRHKSNSKREAEQSQGSAEGYGGYMPYRDAVAAASNFIRINRYLMACGGENPRG